MLRKGFTLIELMVVIAVIGILSSIVLVTYPAAQDRANDGVIMTDAAQMRVQAEIVYDEDGSYEHLTKATVDPVIDALVTDAESHDGAGAGFDFHYTADGSDYTDYCAIITLNSGDQWCIDSNYSAGSTDVSCDEATFCDDSSM